MKKISRILVVLFVGLILQSSLGTKADLVNARGINQNGYKKYEDGMLIQWGYATNNQNSYWRQTVYLPISFYTSSSYIVLTTTYSSFTGYYVGRTVYSLSSGSFIVSANQQNTETFYWFAIGRWK